MSTCQEQTVPQSFLDDEDFPECRYIEDRLLKFDNQKKLKITEEDLVKFEDGEVTHNVASLFIDYFTWTNINQKRVFFLPASVIKKFSKNPQSALLKIQDLLDEQSINNYAYILTLHQDKYTKSDYSLILLHNFQLYEDGPEPQVTVYKTKQAQFSDSEIDTIIDIRKVMSEVMGYQLNKENMPSSIQFINIQQEYQRQVSQSQNEELPQDSILRSIMIVQNLLGNQQSSNIQYSQDSLTKLQDDIRDLLYFLYDYRFFEKFSTLNESSLIVNNRRITGGISKKENSQVLDESSDVIQESILEDSNIFEPEPQSPQQINYQEELQVDKDLESLKEAYEKRQKDQQVQSQKEQDNKVFNYQKLSTIEEENNESLGMSYDQLNHSLQDQGFESPRSLNQIQDNDFIELEQISTEQIKCNDLKEAVEKVQQAAVAVSTVQISLFNPHKRQPKIQIQEEIQVIVPEPKVFIYSESFETNKWETPSLSHVFQEYLEPKAQVFSENQQRHIKLAKSRSLSKKYLIGSYFQQKVLKLKRQSLSLSNKEQFDQQKKIIVNQNQTVSKNSQSQQDFQAHYQLMMMNLFTPESDDQSGNHHSTSIKRFVKQDLTYQEYDETQQLMSPNNDLDHQNAFGTVNQSMIENEDDNDLISNLDCLSTSKDQDYEKCQIISPMTLKNIKNQAGSNDCGDFLNYVDTEILHFTDHNMIEQTGGDSNVCSPDISSNLHQSKNSSNYLVSKNSSHFMNKKPAEFKTQNNPFKNISNNFKTVVPPLSQQKPLFSTKNLKKLNQIQLLSLEQQLQTPKLLPIIPHHQSSLEQNQKDKILQSIKKGKFVFKQKKIKIQSGRIKYKLISHIENVQVNDQNDYQKSIPSVRNSLMQQSVSILNESNDNCKQCQGSNWNQRHNMPCEKCVPIMSARKQNKNKDYPRQMMIL